MGDLYKPPAGAATAAKRALQWMKEGHAGSGFTDVGRKRAVQLAARESLTLDTVKRMYSFFARHEVDKKGKDFDNMEKPSPGRVAWDAWGGDAGFSWAKRIVDSESEEKAMSINETHVFVPIVKFDKNGDGTAFVRGIATDSSLDSDEQICDEEWLKSAMPSWFRWGNIREQHSNISAGVATEYEHVDGQHWVTAHITDFNSVLKVETKTLKGFSIGIRQPRIIKDNKAAGGRIVDGEIVEISLVDRPANPTCMLSLAKSVNGNLVKVQELVEKRDVSSDERERLAERGHAMPDGSYPIANVSDLRNAIQAYGRAKNPAKVKEHIIRRARALGASDLIPDGWEGKKAMSAEESSAPPKKGEESSVPPAEESTGGEESTTGKAATCKACGKAADACKCSEGGFTRDKAVEESSQKPGEESSQKLGEESSRPGGVAGVAGKADSCVHCGDALSKMGEMVTMMYEKMCAVEESAAKSQSEDIAKAVKDVEARVSDIENKAISAVAPVRTAVGSPKTEAVNTNVVKAKDYRAKAMSVTDSRLAEGYLALAIELEKSL